MTQKKAKKFAERNLDWIRSQLDKAESPVALLDGATIPFCGEDYEIVFNPERPRQVAVESTTIQVGGPAEHATTGPP